MLLAEESQEHGQEFMIYSALNEIYSYVNQNKVYLINNVEVFYFNFHRKCFLKN